MDKVTVDRSTCTECGRCVDICPSSALELREDGVALAHSDLCSECGVCQDQCPEGSITLASSGRMPKARDVPEGDRHWMDLSKRLTSLLGLAKAPVGIKLLRPGERAPPGFVQLTSPIRHCVSIHMASLGAALYLPETGHACAAAKAALGIAELPEKVRSGKVPYMHGLASSEASAARIMKEIPKLPSGSVTGTLACPLSACREAPDVVVLTCLPKQAMWVANSLMFDEGGPRIAANFAGMQASCGDVTAVPVMTGKVNFSLGCYGCRSAGKLKDDEMYVGIPTAQLVQVVEALYGLRRAMGMLEKASSGPGGLN